jgi:hypothetical protein
MRERVGDAMDEMELPKLKDEAGWRKLILGSAQPVSDGDATESSAPHTDVSSSPQLPTTALMLSMDVKTSTRATDYMLEWMQNDNFVVTRHSLQWLFTLLVCLDRPTHPDTDGNMRAVLRKLCADRAKMTSVDDPLAADINVLITILTHSFGQVIEYET